MIALNGVKYVKIVKNNAIMSNNKETKVRNIGLLFEFNFYNYLQNII